MNLFRIIIGICLWILVFGIFVSSVNAETFASYDIDTYSHVEGSISTSGSVSTGDKIVDHYRLTGSAASLNSYYGLYFQGQEFLHPTYQYLDNVDYTEYPVTLTYNGITYATGVFRYNEWNATDYPKRIDWYTIHWTTFDVQKMLNDGLTKATVFEFNLIGNELYFWETYSNVPTSPEKCLLLSNTTGMNYASGSVTSAYLTNWQCSVSGDLTSYGLQDILVTTNQNTFVQTKTVADTNLRYYNIYPSETLSYIVYPIGLNITNPNTDIIYNVIIQSPEQQVGMSLDVSPDPPIINQNYSVTLSGVFDLDNYNQVNYYTNKYFDSSRNQVDTLSYNPPKIFLSRVNSTHWNKSILDNENNYYYNIDTITNSEVFHQVFNANYNMTISLSGYYTSYVTLTDTNAKLHTTSYNFTVSGEEYGYSEITFICVDTTTGSSIDYFNLFGYKSEDNINYNSIFSNYGTFSGNKKELQNNFWYYFNVSLGGYDTYTSDSIFIDKESTLYFYLTPSGTTTYGTIKLYIYDSTGNMLPETTCIYSGGGHTNDIVYSPYYYFSFVNFPYDNYTFSISKDGYITANTTINFNSAFTSKNIYLSLIETGDIINEETNVSGFFALPIEFIKENTGATTSEAKMLIGLVVILMCGGIAVSAYQHPITFVIGCLIGLCLSVYITLIPYWILYVCGIGALALVGIKFFIGGGDK